jgi:hypothetical protein
VVSTLTVTKILEGGGAPERTPFDASESRLARDRSMPRLESL